MRFRIEVLVSSEGRWWSPPDGQGEYHTPEAADEGLAQLQVALVESGAYLEGRIVDTDTGQVVHEHHAPRRIASAN